MKQFKEDIKAAKRRGVDVDKVFIETRVQLMEEMAFLFVRIIGLFMSVLGVFLLPPLMVAAKIYLVEHNLHKEVQFPYDLFYWLVAIGFLSILATGFPIWKTIKILRSDKCEVIANEAEVPERQDVP